MTDLTAWLTRIWDEQEKAARAVKPLGEVVVMGGEHHPETFGHSRHTFASEDGYPRTLSDPEARAHFALHDPASVLARIAADRQILALHSFHMVAAYDSQFKPIPGTEEPRCDTCASQDENGEDWPCDTIRLLALPHADRPGYQETWRLS